MASGHMNRVKRRPDTWLHRPTLQNVKKVLANPEPSTHGLSRRSPRRYVRIRAPTCLPRGSIDAIAISDMGDRLSLRQV